MANTLAFQLFSLRNFTGGYGAAFEAVKALGIDTIEAWCGAVPDDPDAGTSLEDLQADLERSDMKLTCGHISVAEFDARYDKWKKLLRDFGSKDWVIPFATADTLSQWLELLPKFREMAEVLQSDGLSLGYHNHHMELRKLGDKYVFEHLLDNMPELKAQFHIGQFLPERDINLTDWIRKYEGRICSLHVNDADSSGATGLGKGDCCVEECIRAALDSGVDTFILEVELVQSNVDEVKRDIEFTGRLVR